MEDVTDCAFREMFARYSKPSLTLPFAKGGGVPTPLFSKEGQGEFVMFTEFVSTDGLMHEEGRKKLLPDLAYTEIQRPIIAQIWGTDPEKFRKVAELIVELGFDGIDINMGCPQAKEIGVGACAALIRTPDLAVKIINATIQGAGPLPVSVKTRLGYSKTDEMEGWISRLLQTDIKALTLHGRTKKEMSKVPTHWDKIAEAVEIRNRENPNVVLLGNGDIRSRKEGLQRVAETGVDGVMIGRGAFGCPWFFNPNVIDQPVVQAPGLPITESSAQQATGLHYITPRERLQIMIEHAELFEKMYTGKKPFQIMRKHFKAYCSGFAGAAELRAQLMETRDVAETKTVVANYLQAEKPRQGT